MRNKAKRRAMAKSRAETDRESESMRSIKAISALTIIVSFNIAVPARAIASDETAKLVERLRNGEKLKGQARKFEAAFNRVKPLASKAKLDKKDLELIESFIQETDEGEPIAARAEAKAFAAAQQVRAFEDSAK